MLGFDISTPPTKIDSPKMLVAHPMQAIFSWYTCMLTQNLQPDKN
jgi:hypothetical protein